MRRIFAEMLTSGSPTQIAANLSAEGINTKAWTTQDGQTRSGKRIDKQLMMSKQEVKQEMKQNEQSQEIRGAIARQRRRMSRQRMAQAMKKADVVVTNPTHYAVAIEYDAGKSTAPIIVAKGTDLMAAKIRELAAQNNVPIVPNPPLARALYRQCEIGDPVPRELFQPVAEVLAFVYKTLRRVRKK